MSAARQPAPLRINVVADVVCPWCAIGLAALEQTIERVLREITAGRRG